MRLEVIKTDNGYIAVSDEKIKENDFVCIDKNHFVKAEIFHGTLGYTRGPAVLYFREKERFAKVIIATASNFEIDKLPQFENPVILTNADVQYTAEEVRKIIYFSLNVGADKKSWKLPFEYADEMKGIKELIAIEVETKCGVANPCECSERNLDCQVLKPKIIGNNLIVKEYIFN